MIMVRDEEWEEGAWKAEKGEEVGVEIASMAKSSECKHIYRYCIRTHCGINYTYF